jgi:sulfonate transport system ATP-binding protein
MQQLSASPLGSCTMPVTDGRAAIRLAGVDVRYGDFVALRHVNLEVGPGEFVALIGPSGCGKTSLFRAISGAAEVSGDVFVSGAVGIVYQDLKLLPWHTVKSNIALGRSDPEARDERINQIIHEVGLTEKEAAYPYELSGGQKQRVAIARALCAGGMILLLDEPFSALDFIAKARLIGLLLDLRSRNPELALLFVTHDIDDAFTLADRLILLREGNIIGGICVKDMNPDARAESKQQILTSYGGTDEAT